GSITDEAGVRVTANGNATLTGTSISLAANTGDLLSVGGNATFATTGGGAITVALPGTTRFGSLTFSAPGSTVSIAEDDSTLLAGSNTATNLTQLFSAGTSIGDAAGTTLSVTGVASFVGTSAAVTLGSSPGDTINLGSLTFNVLSLDIAEDSDTQLSVGSA